MNLPRPVVESPHQGGLIQSAGEPLERARAAMLMVHGRGASAEDILSLVGQFGIAGFAYLAPQAANNTWYPNRFLAPLSQNEPWLSSALAFLDETYRKIIPSVPPERLIFLGFSQGACLTLEYAARHARRFGGLVGLSGAIIGPENLVRNYAGSLEGTPVFLGCSDMDPHIPKERVDATAEVLQRLGGQVTERIYPQMGHIVNPDEIGFVRQMMQSVLAGV